MIAMDQGNTLNGQSTGLVEINDPWGTFASDQIALMDHLGIGRFFALGICIGCPSRSS